MLKELFCTWEGVGKLKRWTAFVCGALVITVSILTLLNPFEILNYVRCFWNVVFGFLIIFLQLKWLKMIKRNFGFLLHWFMRGVFYIFVGTNIMTTDGKDKGKDFFSIVVGLACLFVGVVELLFGFKCNPQAEDDDDVEAAQSGKEKKSTKGKKGGNTVEPTITVNLTPNQIAQGASFAANNAGAVAAAATAAGAASSGGGGGGGNNPFFGNAHLNRQ